MTTEPTLFDTALDLAKSERSRLLPDMKFCPGCGHEIDPRAEICPDCEERFTTGDYEWEWTE